MIEQTVEVLRWINATVGLAIFAIMMRRLWRYKYTQLVRMFIVAVSLYVLGVTEASAENAVLNTEPGLRSAIYAAAHVGLARVLWKTRTGKQSAFEVREVRR